MVTAVVSSNDLAQSNSNKSVISAAEQTGSRVHHHWRSSDLSTACRSGKVLDASSVDLALNGVHWRRSGLVCNTWLAR